MKALVTALAVAAFGGSAFAAEPVGKRTPNGGYEYYSNQHAGKGTIENGCILPWFYAGHHTLGKNPKRIDRAGITEFYDCEIEPAKVAVVEKTEVVVVEQPKPAPAPVMEEPKPAPVPAPIVTETRKKIRE